MSEQKKSMEFTMLILGLFGAFIAFAIAAAVSN